ncbi:hypothetical protein C8J56DRAFT_1021033 [Mycena floridula]|nr:hypothetical protein C8J56DRAFT_1021033 [Mycena floridula]
MSQMLGGEHDQSIHKMNAARDAPSGLGQCGSSKQTMKSPSGKESVPMKTDISHKASASIAARKEPGGGGGGEAMGRGDQGKGMHVLITITMTARQRRFEAGKTGAKKQGPAELIVQWIEQGFTKNKRICNDDDKTIAAARPRRGEITNSKPGPNKSTANLIPNASETSSQILYAWRRRTIQSDEKADVPKNQEMVVEDKMTRMNSGPEFFAGCRKSGDGPCFSRLLNTADGLSQSYGSSMTLASNALIETRISLSDMRYLTEFGPWHEKFCREFLVLIGPADVTVRLES